MIYKIYKITDNTNGNCYVGQTTQKLNDRIIDHKSTFKRGESNCSSKYIGKKIGLKQKSIG